MRNSEAKIARPRWFGATPLPYEPGATGFWFRDLGALCGEFDRLNVDSQFVVYGGPAQADRGKPLLLCTPEEMANAEWWRQWKVDGVILNSWGAPRFTPIARAVKEAGVRLIVRLDSDGLKSPRQDFVQFFRNTYGAARDARLRFPGLYAGAKSVAFRWWPALHDRKFLEHLALADVVTVESILARLRLERLMDQLGARELASKLHVVPHFAAVERGYDPASPKLPIILAVGRWNAYQKDGPKMIRVLGRVLARRPDYRAMVVGGGREAIEPSWRRLPAEVRSRLELVGFLPHEQVQQHYRDSRILFFSSRFEGFPFAASEALCCGCTVVGPAALPSMVHTTAAGGGTVAVTRSDEDLCEALWGEMEAWELGWREPDRISQWWMKQVSARAVARRLLELGGVKLN